MFIYQRNGAICVTFEGNAPVETPDYVIVIDEKAKTVTVNGKSFNEVVEPVIEQPAPKKRASKPVVEEVAPVVEETPAEEAPVEE